MNSKTMKVVLLLIAATACFFGAVDIFASSGVGINVVAEQARSNLVGLAKLITAGSYVGGMAFGVASITKFKAHKDNPQQQHISQPIAYLFLSAALLFIPNVFSSSGATLFGTSGTQAGLSGISSF